MGGRVTDVLDEVGKGRQGRRSGCLGIVARKVWEGSEDGERRTEESSVTDERVGVVDGTDLEGGGIGGRRFAEDSTISQVFRRALE